MNGGRHTGPRINAFTGLGSDGRVLANGVYLSTATAYGLNGETAQRKVGKLAILR